MSAVPVALQCKEQGAEVMRRAAGGSELPLVLQLRDEYDRVHTSRPGRKDTLSGQRRSCLSSGYSAPPLPIFGSFAGYAA
jgi:hypothetical protein